MRDYDKEIEELETRRREVGLKLRKKKEGAPRRKLVLEGIQLDRRIKLLKTERKKDRAARGAQAPVVEQSVRSPGPGVNAMQGEAPAPKMSAVEIGVGVTHLVDQTRGGSGPTGSGPQKTLCGITLMGEQSYPMEDRSMSRFLRHLDECDPPICRRCRGRLKGRYRI